MAMRLRLAPIAAGFFPRFTADEVDRARRYHRPIYVSFAVGARPRARDARGALGLRDLARRAVVARSAAFRVRRRRALGARPASGDRLARLGARAALGLLDPVGKRLCAEDFLKKLLADLRVFCDPRDGGRGALAGVSLVVACDRRTRSGAARPRRSDSRRRSCSSRSSTASRRSRTRRLAGDLLALAARAGVPVRDVLVADASRRTRKVNAYVSGIGATRRVVLYDTLLREGAAAPSSRSSSPTSSATGAPATSRRARRSRCSARRSATLVVWALLPDPQDPAIAPKLLLITAVLELLALPFEAALSRRWERVADRFSLDVTADRDAYRAVHHDLALANLGDLRAAAARLSAALQPSDRARADRPGRLTRRGSRERPVLQSRRCRTSAPWSSCSSASSRFSSSARPRFPRSARSLGRATREFKDSVTGTGIREALEGVNDVRSA